VDFFLLIIRELLKIKFLDLRNKHLKKDEKSWLADDFEIWYRSLDIDFKQLSLIIFCRICHIKGILLYREIDFFESFQGILDFSKLKSC
jgi:hypothetical protein